MGAFKPMTTQPKTKIKFTPAPWYVEHPFNEPGIYITSHSTALISKVYDHASCSDTPREMREQNEQEAEANARLISASPELFEALESMMSFINYDKLPGPIEREQAENALRKAQGEPNV